jgi:hypothetical protein
VGAAIRIHVLQSRGVRLAVALVERALARAIAAGLDAEEIAAAR